MRETFLSKTTVSRCATCEEFERILRVSRALPKTFEKGLGAIRFDKSIR